jgi:hypothetical protein
MKEYFQDIDYVKRQIAKSIIIDEINHAKRTLRHFEDKWMVRLSPTDPAFQKDRAELNRLYQEKYTQISRAYLFTPN